LKGKKPSAIYFYSRYERTVWRDLSKCFSDVVIEYNIDETFASEAAMDLYFDVVRPKIEWRHVAGRARCGLRSGA
jgi:hypothetical protein